MRENMAKKKYQIRNSLSPEHKTIAKKNCKRKVPNTKWIEALYILYMAMLKWAEFIVANVHVFN